MNKCIVVKLFPEEGLAASIVISFYTIKLSIKYSKLTFSILFSKIEYLFNISLFHQYF